MHFRCSPPVNPRSSTGSGLRSDFRLAQTKQVLIAGDPMSQDTHELLREVNTRFLPNKILLLADGGAGQQQLARWLPFVAGAHRMKDRATAYVCENYVCKLPTGDPQVMARLLEKQKLVSSWPCSRQTLHAVRLGTLADCARVTLVFYRRRAFEKDGRVGAMLLRAFDKTV